MSDAISIRLGDWRDVLADVEACDALICDPPYGARTHEEHAVISEKTSRGALGYTHLKPFEVFEIVKEFARRSRGWMACMTSDDLIADWRGAFRAVDRVDFPPVPILQHRPRLQGDGPGSGAVYLMVSRPRGKEWSSWGSLPCWYEATPQKGSGVVGAKPLDLMRAIVRDYSRPGDLVVDPFCGSGTTAVACAIEGRHCITSELDPKTFAIAQKRLARGHTRDMFSGGAP